jgi:hypothetical protein
MPKTKLYLLQLPDADNIVSEIGPELRRFNAATGRYETLSSV